MLEETLEIEMFEIIVPMPDTISQKARDGRGLEFVWEIPAEWSQKMPVF
jgi:hypothetical protein